MKSVWLWIVFLLLYGVFSMKTHAAGLDVAGQSEVSRSGGVLVSLGCNA